MVRPEADAFRRPWQADPVIRHVPFGARRVFESMTPEGG